MAETYYLISQKTKTYLWVAQTSHKNPKRLHLYTRSVAAYLAMHQNTPLLFATLNSKSFPDSDDYVEVIPKEENGNVIFVVDPEDESELAKKLGNDWKLSYDPPG